MDRLTKRDKTILVILVVIQIFAGSIGRAVGIKMASSISLLILSGLFIIYILVQKSKTKFVEAKNTLEKRTRPFKFTNKLIAVLTITLAVIFGFYWYELRPSQIKKDCYRTARESAIKNADRLDDKFYVDEYNNLYKICLQKKGL